MFTRFSTLIAVTLLAATVTTSAQAVLVGNGAGVNGTFNGSINGSMNGAFNGSMNGSMNGTFNGSINGSMNGTFNGSINGSMNGTFQGSMNGSTLNGAIFNGTERRAFDGRVLMIELPQE